MKKIHVSGYVLLLAGIASLGGLLFGYNTGVISGAAIFVADQMQLSLEQEAGLVSTILIGALIGALLGGSLTDLLGRKRSLFVTAFLFLIGTFFLVKAHTLTSLLIGRFIQGLGVGIVSVAAPLYIAEISPTKARGMLVSFNQLAITIGILISYIIDYSFADIAQWRWMFGFAFLPTIVMLIALFIIPETPSWLSSHGRKLDARKIMDKINPRRGEGKEDSLEGEKHERMHRGRFRDLFSHAIRPAFITGVGISVFQQITGINAIVYYAPRVFQLAGFASPSTAIFATMIMGLINVGMTILALWLIDYLGRKPLLLIGLSGMSICLFTLGLAFLFKGESIGIISIITIIGYVSFFAISLGPVAWLIISEIYPLQVRGKAMGIAIFANWACNYLVSSTFRDLLQYLGASGTFWLYTFISLLGILFVIRKVPETKNKTFDEIQHFWQKAS